MSLPKVMSPARPRGLAAGAFALLPVAAFLVPSLGATTDLVFQDTVKSAIWALAATVAVLLLLASPSRSAHAVAWHPVLLVPLGLSALAFAAGQFSSTTNTWLANTEAIRWALVAVLAWLGMNLLDARRALALATAIWGGAVIASGWALLQFLGGLELFAQGRAHPASTFANRNFFAEYAVAALPFAGPALLAAAKSRRSRLLLPLAAAATGAVVVAVMATGMRAALWTMWTLVPVGLWLLYRPLAARAGRAGVAVAAASLLGVVAGLGNLPTADAAILADGRGGTAMERAINRTTQSTAEDSSLGARLVMWRATTDMIVKHPVFGLGAGGWERQVPLHLPAGYELELDYFAHNEYLQLAAEYGLPAALAALGGLIAFFTFATRALWTARGSSSAESCKVSWAAAGSLLALGAVSVMGFALHMAATTALFALSLGLLARVTPLRLVNLARPPVDAARQAAIAVCTLAMLATVIITVKAFQAERALILAYKYAMRSATLAQTGAPAPMVEADRDQAFDLALAGVQINPHYRRLIPQIGEELARGGGHGEAVALWEVMLESRPHVVAILTNAARSYLAFGSVERANAYLERARAIAPDAPAVRALEVTLLATSGKRLQALDRVRAALAGGHANVDLLSNGLVLASLAGDAATAADCRSRLATAGDGALAGALLQLGNFWAQETNSQTRARASWAEALAAGPDAATAALLEKLLAAPRPS